MNRHGSTAKCEIIMTVFLIMLKHLKKWLILGKTVDIIASGIVETYGKLFFCSGKVMIKINEIHKH